MQSAAVAAISFSRKKAKKTETEELINHDGS
jgi:hypothetical protein